MPILQPTRPLRAEHGRGVGCWAVRPFVGANSGSQPLLVKVQPTGFWHQQPVVATVFCKDRVAREVIGSFARSLASETVPPTSGLDQRVLSWSHRLWMRLGATWDDARGRSFALATTTDHLGPDPMSSRFTCCDMQVPPSRSKLETPRGPQVSCSTGHSVAGRRASCRLSSLLAHPLPCWTNLAYMAHASSCRVPCKIINAAVVWVKDAVFVATVEIRFTTDEVSPRAPSGWMRAGPPTPLPNVASESDDDPEDIDSDVEECTWSSVAKLDWDWAGLYDDQSIKAIEEPPVDLSLE